MKTFKDIYKFPLINHYGHIYDSANNFVFQFQIADEKLSAKLLRVINGKECLKNEALLFRHEGGLIKSNQDIGACILIRGWGNLTGAGAHNLPADEASNIQDTFAEYIVKQLNKRN